MEKYKQKIFSIPFRGSRNYNWGPDFIKPILDYQTKFYKSNLENIVVKINRFSTKDIRICSQEENPINFSGESLIGTIKFQNKNCIKRLLLLEENKKNNLERIDFNESNYLNKHLVTESNNGILIKYSDHQIALLVCANKYILTKIFGLKIWTFASLKIKKYPFKNSPFQIKYNYNITNKLYISDISQDEINIGQIIFGVKGG